MNIIFSEDQRRIRSNYVDDMITYSQGFRQHMQRLKYIFDKLREYYVKLKSSKCHIMKENFNFLGHQISEEEVHHDLERKDAVSNFQVPKNVKDVKHILGFTGYFRRFYKDHAFKSEPLVRLLRKDSKWKWTEQQQKAWQWLQYELLEGPILCHKYPKAEHWLLTDACDYCISGVLAQYVDGKLMGYVAAVSKIMNPVERNWSTTEKKSAMPSNGQFTN